MPVYCYGAAVTTVFCVLLIVADRLDSQRLRWVFKPLASAGFIAAALSWGAPRSALSVAVVIALGLSLIGDVLLIPKHRGAFLPGLDCFLAGHLGFGAAFLVRGVSPLGAGLALVPLVPAALLVHRWLKPHLPDRMRAPVLAYITVITTMVTLAAGTLVYAPTHQGGLLMGAAVSFFLSDLAVARNQFVAHHWTNRLWGLPLYYGAQLCFAYALSLPT